MTPAPRRPLWAFTVSGHLLGPDPALDRRDVAMWCEESGTWQPGPTWPGTVPAKARCRAAGGAGLLGGPEMKGGAA
jgi:hypothetical protein